MGFSIKQWNRYPSDGSMFYPWLIWIFPPKFVPVHLPPFPHSTRLFETTIEEVDSAEVIYADYLEFIQ